MKKILSVILCVIVLSIALLTVAYAAGTDDLIARVKASPRDQWGTLFSQNIADINDILLKKLVDTAETDYNRKDYKNSLLNMEIADYADYIRADRKVYAAIYQSFLGRMLLQDEQYDWVLRAADNIQAVNPGNIKASMLRGKAYLKRKEADKALSELKAVVENDPNSEDGQLSLGYAYVLKGDNQSAIKPFQEVLRINPNNSYAKDAVALLTGNTSAAWKSENAEAMLFFNQAEKSYASGKYEDAIQGYSRAIELDPKFAKAWVYMGDSYLGLKNSRKAIECYRKAIEINPKDRQANRFLGDVLEKQYDRTGDISYLDEAIKCYENALKADPSYATAASDLERAKGKKAARK
jgi:tetratricopeptide (TPR) repeat protein